MSEKRGNKRYLIYVAFFVFLALMIILLIPFLVNTFPFVSSQVSSNTTENLNPYPVMDLDTMTYNSNSNLFYSIQNNYPNPATFRAYNTSSREVYNLTGTGNFGVYPNGPTFYDMIYDSTNNLVYLSGSNLFLVYNKTDNITYSISRTTGFTGSPNFYDLDYDLANGLIYVIGSSGAFGVYNRSIGVLQNLTGTDPGNWISNTDIIALTYDSSHDLVYLLVGGSGYLAVYNRTKGENGTTEILNGFSSADYFNAMAYDSTNDLVYLVGNNEFFRVYNRTSNVTSSLSDKDPGDWMGTTDLEGVTYDSDKDLLYLAGDDAIFGVYNITSDVTEDLRDTDSGDWVGSAPSIKSLFYDSGTGLVYFGGTLSTLGAYNRTSNVTGDLFAKYDGDWIRATPLRSLTYDSNNKLIYLSGEQSAFGFYNTSSYNLSNLRTADPGNWMGTAILYDVTYDLTNGLVYLVGYSTDETTNLCNKFGVYNLSSGAIEDLRATDVGGWLDFYIDPGLQAVTYDSTNDLVYLGGGSMFGYYNRTSNKTYNLNDTDGGWLFPGGTVSALTYDSTNDLVYLSGGGGKFGVYNRTSNISTNLTETDPGNWIGTASILGLTYNSNNNLVYLAGASGKFGVYDRTSSITTNLSATDTGNWMGTTTIWDLTYDPNRSLVYLAGASGLFGVYDSTSGVTEDLRGTDTGNWTGTSTLYGVTYDSNSGLIYLAGAAGIFGVYNRTSNVTSIIEPPAKKDTGGSGGVVTTPGTTTPIQVEKGVPTTVNIVNSSLDQIIITSNVTANATISVTPTTFPIFTDLRVGGEGRVYDTFEIKTTGINNSNIENVTLRFKVNISWTIANGVDPTNVSLFRNEEIFWFFPNWVELPTTFIGSDSQYYYYEAVSPGFSDFAIFIAITQCELGTIRCFNNEAQLCVGNYTWVVTKECEYGCEGNRCDEGPGIGIMGAGSVVVYVIVAIISAGILVILYFVFKSFSKKRAQEVWKKSQMRRK